MRLSCAWSPQCAEWGEALGAPQALRLARASQGPLFPALEAARPGRRAPPRGKGFLGGMGGWRLPPAPGKGEQRFAPACLQAPDQPVSALPGASPSVCSGLWKPMTSWHAVHNSVSQAVGQDTLGGS